MFTGKNKEDFEKWYLITHCKTSMTYEELMPHHKQEVYGWFYDLKDSFKQGVYLEYLDSVGYVVDLSIIMGAEIERYFSYSIKFRNTIKVYCENKHTRQEALKEAFKKADELINSK